jgi:hypothetical protein
VSFLGFTLTPDGIKPGKNKLKAIKDAKPPTDIKTIQSFVGLCNFFRTHIKNFALIAAPLFKLTRKDSGYKSGPLPEKALKAFFILQKQLTSEPVMAFPKSNHQYALITDGATGTADTPGGLGAILPQVDQEGNFHTISFASRQLKDHEMNYSAFLLEALPLCGGWISSMNTSRAKIHPIHGSQAIAETWSLAKKNAKPTANSFTGA